MACCSVKATSPAECPVCGRAGRPVNPITVKAMLRPEALMRLSAPEHRFCAAAECPVVYFGQEGVFDREEIAVPVFQKKPTGTRTVCYCFAVTEEDIQRELLETGHSAASERIAALVKADRCACEVKNPQWSCCLGNVSAITRAPQAAVESEHVAATRGAEASGLGAVCGNTTDGRRVVACGTH